MAFQTRNPQLSIPSEDAILAQARPIGSISGHVFKDRNGDGIENGRDGPLANKLVFVDLDHDGVRDRGERAARTDDAGNYLITGVGEGEYYVQVAMGEKFHGTTPAALVTQYSWDDYSYDFQEIAGEFNKVVLTNLDDGFGFLEPEGNISFHGDRHDLYISANGYVSFDVPPSTPYDHINQTLPSFVGPSNMIAPLWDDFDTSLGGGVYVTDTGSSVIVEWKDVRIYGDTTGEGSTFEMVLNYDGTIEFHYQHVAANVTATIGVQIEHGIEATQIAGVSARPADRSAYVLTPGNHWEYGVAIVGVNAGEVTSGVDIGLSKGPAPTPAIHGFEIGQHAPMFGHAHELALA